MNRIECDVLKTVIDYSLRNQRRIAEVSGYSLGTVNAAVKKLVLDGCLKANGEPTEKAMALYESSRPENAVILAAGFGMRMVPINMETSKGLLEVGGEPLIERLIRQLQEVGVKDITIVVGYMKEKYDYLIDEYDVDLVVNKNYVTTNNIHSLHMVSDRLRNTYIIPCDIYSRSNPFSAHEFYPWYLMSETLSQKSGYRVNRKMEIVRVPAHGSGNRMIGIAYVTERESEKLKKALDILCADPQNDQLFWEEAAIFGGRMELPAKMAEEDDVIEIDTYEQLRELDSNSNNLHSDAIKTIAEVFRCPSEEITNIKVLKKGMTNRSFLFSCRGDKYIMRIPGEGTDKLINRRQEAIVYETIRGKGLCDDVVYINPDNGYKITKFLEGIRVADPENEDDLQKCMAKLKEFHEMKLKVDHDFDIFGQIRFYESLWEGQPSVYRDYLQTKEKVLSLESYIQAHVQEKVLTHIDAVPDNFLFYQNAEGKEELQLTDWEYAGMQDPHVDIAMFCIYSLYNKKQVDHLIDIYFADNCPEETRIKIYCYVAACGLLWSNWCEYKRSLGVEFGEYSLRQYRFAKDYWRYAAEGMKTCTE